MLLVIHKSQKDGNAIADMFRYMNILAYAVKPTDARAGLCHAMEKGLILEAVPYLCDKEMCLWFSLGGGIRGMMPRPDAAYTQTGGAVKDIAVLTRVGKPSAFKVLSVGEDREGRPLARLSRKEAQRECAENYVSGLRPGDIIPARVTHLAPFGAFLDVGCGISALLSIENISVSRIAHPRCRLCVGDGIFAVVKEIDALGRIYLTERELLGTWEENVSRFSEGQTVRGVVRGVENYGIFVELTPNLSGLAEYREGVEVGDVAAVYIKSILPEKMKIKLSVIDAVRAEDTVTPLSYFVDVTATHRVDYWRYSPKNAGKVLETVF